MTLTLLNALGIEARAALVNTKTRRGVLDQRASPGVFNHVLVRARLDGAEYWIDPTRAPQVGGLQAISQARFGAALVVDAATGSAAHARRTCNALLPQNALRF
ncbi:MAG: hypothetical protein IPF71_07660 [Rhodoferax sp.]|nr:hypothetical protein [Rhodoferax sp.]